MQLTKTHKIIISLVISLLLTFIYIAFDRYNKKSVSNTDSVASTTVKTIPGTGLSVEGNSDYTITQIPVEEKKVVMPDLKRPIVFSPSANLNDDAKKIITDKILSLQTSLKNDPKNIMNWVQLGNIYKITGDYVGAIMYWKYASDVSNDFISLGNLGGLYAYYLHDNGLAEIYYKKAISRSPTSSYLYVQLSAVYKDVFKDGSKASSIIEEGLKAIPNDPSLLEAKKNL